MGNDAGQKYGQTDRYRELFERSADANLILEGDRFVDCNQAAVDMLHYSSREQVLQTHPSELSPPTQSDGAASYEKANKMIALARERGSHRFEWEHVRRDGEVFPVEVLLTAVDRGDVPALHVVWRDRTERCRLEEELRQSQKMEALGKLAGGVAHDFNNMLVVIFWHCNLLQQRSQDTDAHRSVSAIREAGERAAGLVHQLMSFSRSRTSTNEVVELGAVLQEFAPLLRKIIGEHISLEISPHQDCPVQIDPSQFDQIIMNLATNARDAMPEGGALLIDVSGVQSAPGNLPRGRYACLTVTDTGIGMGPTEARRAFDPFYTTKPAGRGTGFGLSTVYSIATQSGGIAVIESVPNQGTKVRVYFPLTITQQSDSTTIPASSNCHGTERILVVEDEQEIATLVSEDLRERGYTVFVARNGIEALRIIKAEDSHSIDLIVTDVIMPKMTGAALVRRVREFDHQPKVLFMSGYTDDALDALGSDAVNLLAKPFTPDQLAERVREILDTPPVPVP